MTQDQTSTDQWAYRYVDSCPGMNSGPVSEQYARQKAEADLSVVVLYRDHPDAEWAEVEQDQDDVTLLREMFEQLGGMVATDSRDWSLTSSDAWLFGLFCGWECEEDHETHDDICGGFSPLTEVAIKHQWTAGDLTRLRRYRAVIRSLAAETHQDECAACFLPRSMHRESANQPGKIQHEFREEQK